MPSTQPPPSAAPPTVTVPANVPVSIQIKPDNFVDSPQVGGWTASGATNDLGRYERTPTASTPPCFCTTQPEAFEEAFVLTNDQKTGTLTIKAQQTATTTPGEPPRTTGVWVITSGTGIYNRVTRSGTDEFISATLTLSLTGVMTKVS
jgi:hypothetical protein